MNSSWALVAQAYNPNYSGGRDQEDGGSKPAWANSSQDPISKKPITKKAWWSRSRCSPEFKSQYQKKRKLISVGCRGSKL
jgi:hypothetical protein